MTVDEALLDTTIPDHLQESWLVARRNFGPFISFFAPAVKRYSTEEFPACGSCSFMGVSITGGECDLQCDHCKAEILKPMTPTRTPGMLWEAAQGFRARGAGGILISGGSDLNGVVPLLPFMKTMKRIKTELGMKINVHVGIPTEEIIEGLADVGIDSAMMDIIGSEETLEKVYHLKKVTIADFERALGRLCEAGVQTSPHIVIGLHWGKIMGEFEALRITSQFKIASLVLVALMPAERTPMVDVIPPSPVEMSHVFGRARLLFPKTNILLGCERPLGEHKIFTDIMALKAGVNGIAYPAEGVVQMAHQLGLKSSLSDMCCSLKYQGI